MSQLLNPIHVVGVSTVTSNKEAFEQQTIAALWNAFLNTPIKEQLKNPSSSVYAVYSDYENEHHGRYRITIGYAVENIQELPSGLSVSTIPGGHYKQYQSKSLSVEDVIDVWNTIWNTDSKSLPRNYVADFEEHTGETVKIYIGHD